MCGDQRERHPHVMREGTTQMRHLTTWIAVTAPTTLARLRERQEGQTMAEYALILGLIAIFVIVALIFLRGAIEDIFNRTGSSIQGAS